MPLLLDIPFPADFGDKLWDNSPLLYFLVIAVGVLIVALAWTARQLRKAEDDRAKALLERSGAAKDLENFIHKVEATRREDAREIAADARENIKILAGLSNVLDRLVHEQTRSTDELRNEIRREAEATKTHVTSAIVSLRQNHPE